MASNYCTSGLVAKLSQWALPTTRTCIFLQQLSNFHPPPVQHSLASTPRGLHQSVQLELNIRHTNHTYGSHLRASGRHISSSLFRTFHESQMESILHTGYVMDYHEFYSILNKTTMGSWMILLTYPYFHLIWKNCPFYVFSHIQLEMGLGNPALSPPLFFFFFLPIRVILTIPLFSREGLLIIWSGWCFSSFYFWRLTWWWTGLDWFNWITFVLHKDLHIASLLAFLLYMTLTIWPCVLH